MPGKPVHLAFLPGAARRAARRRPATAGRAAGEWQAAGGIKFGSLEVTEVRFPLFFRRHEFRPDSGGDGKYRGGPGGIVEMVVETAEPAVGNTAGDGVRHGACGILGGVDGSPHRYILYSEGREPREISTKETGMVIRPGDRLVLESAAAAAGATPAKRPPESRTRRRRIRLYSRQNGIPSPASGGGLGRRSADYLRGVPDRDFAGTPKAGSYTRMR